MVGWSETGKMKARQLWSYVGANYGACEGVNERLNVTCRNESRSGWIMSRYESGCLKGSVR